MVQLYCHFMETRCKAPCGQAASVGVPVGCVRIAKAALRRCTCAVLLSENVRKYIYMMKKISRRSFLQVCGITAAAAALTACGGKTETAKKDGAHEAVTFMAPYKEIEAFIEQVHSVYPKEAGMDEHLSKPVDIAALEQTVKRFRVTLSHKKKIAEKRVSADETHK